MKNAYWNNIFTNWGKEESENVTIIKKIPIFANLNHKELEEVSKLLHDRVYNCLLYTSPSPRDGLLSRMPSSA